MIFVGKNVVLRLEELESFTLEQCQEALKTPLLQKKVKTALERRIRRLKWSRNDH